MVRSRLCGQPKRPIGCPTSGARDWRCGSRQAASRRGIWPTAFEERTKMRRLSLGRTTDVGLEQARERANELTSAARGGRDLVGEEGEARVAAASRITVPEADRPLSATASCRPPARTAKSIESRLRRTLAANPSTICRRYLPTRHPRDLGQHRRPGQRSRSRKAQAGLHRDFRWALSQDIVAADPTAGLEAYDHGTPRDRVLTVGEIETLWRWLEFRRSLSKRRTF